MVNLGPLIKRHMAHSCHLLGAGRPLRDFKKLCIVGQGWTPAAKRATSGVWAKDGYLLLKKPPAVSELSEARSQGVTKVGQVLLTGITQIQIWLCEGRIQHREDGICSPAVWEEDSIHGQLLLFWGGINGNVSFSVALALTLKPHNLVSSCMSLVPSSSPHPQAAVPLPVPTAIAYE